MMIKALQVNLLGARIELARESIVTIDHSLGVSQRKKELQISLACRRGGSARYLRYARPYL